MREREKNQSRLRPHLINIIIIMSSSVVSVSLVIYRRKRRRSTDGPTDRQQIKSPLNPPKRQRGIGSYKVDPKKGTQSTDRERLLVVYFLHTYHPCVVCTYSSRLDLTNSIKDLHQSPYKGSHIQKEEKKEFLSFSTSMQLL